MTDLHVLLRRLYASPRYRREALLVNWRVWSKSTVCMLWSARYGD